MAVNDDRAAYGDILQLVDRGVLSYADLLSGIGAALVAKADRGDCGCKIECGCNANCASRLNDPILSRQRQIHDGNKD